MTTAHIVGAEATLERCSTGTMELLVIQELTLAVAHIRASNTLVPLVRACVNAVMLSSSLLENKNKHATVKSHKVHKIHFTLNNTVTAVHPPVSKLAIMHNPESGPSTSNPNNPSPQDPCNLFSSHSLSSRQEFLTFHHHSSIHNPCPATLATCTNHSSLVTDNTSACQRSCIQKLSLRPEQMQVGKHP